MIKKKKIAFILVIILIISAFDAFEFTPLFGIIKGFLMMTSGAGFVLFIFYFKKYPKSLKQFGLLFVALFVISIITANFVHHQSYFSGVIANSAIFISGSVFLIYYVMMKYRIDVHEIKRLLLIFSWIQFSLIAVVFVTGLNFVPDLASDSGGIQPMRKDLINLGSLIYLGFFFQKNHFKYLIFSLLLFSANHWGDMQRFLLMVYIICFVAMYLSYRNRMVGIKIVAISLLVVPVLITLISVTNAGSEFAKKMSSAFELFESERDQYSDVSVESRVLQSEFAVKNIKEHPLTGVGRVRTSEKEMVVGDTYFHVSDIGILGVVYSYGILGLFIFIYQWIFTLRMFRKKDREMLSLHTGFVLFALFMVVQAIAGGRSIHVPAEFMLIIALLEIGRLNLKVK